MYFAEHRHTCGCPDSALLSMFRCGSALSMFFAEYNQTCPVGPMWVCVCVFLLSTARHVSTLSLFFFIFFYWAWSDAWMPEVCIFTEHGQTRECRKCVFLLSMVRRVNALSARHVSALSAFCWGGQELAPQRPAASRAPPSTYQRRWPAQGPPRCFRRPNYVNRK